MYIQLNDAQKEAVNHNEGAMLVLAGPGSGKTTIIALRIENLIKNHNVNSNRILVISFAKSSAIDMEERFRTLTNIQSKVNFGTFHSIFFRIIRECYGYTVKSVINEFEKNNLLKNIANQIGLEYDDEEEFFKNVNSELTLVKNELIDIENYNSINFSNGDFSSLYKMYEEYKEEKNKIDFDDMLSKCYEALTTNPHLLRRWQSMFDYILIDEFQDINLVQYKCIRLLTENNKNIFAVGDDDQSIYRFRGAKPEIILNFVKDYDDCKKVILNINYRSTDEIINLSNKIISENNARYEKVIKGTESTYKYPVMVNYKDVYDESSKVAERIRTLIYEKNVPPEEIAVIFRTNIQAVSVLESLQDLNIPFVLKDTVPSIYNHFIAKDILAYLKLSLNNCDKESFKRVVNKPKRFISKNMQEKITELGGNCLNNIYKIDGARKFELENIEGMQFYLNAVKKRKPYDAIRYIRNSVGYDDYVHEYCIYKKIKSKNLFDVLNEFMEASKKFESINDFVDYCQKQVDNDIVNDKQKDVEGVVLTTYHSVKGLEFEVVFLISLVEDVLPYELCKTHDEIEEERRLFYVGLTRAKKELYLSTVEKRYEKEVSKSIFLDNLIKRRK